MNYPFQSKGVRSETDADVLEASRRIGGAVFTPEENGQIRAELSGCKLAVSANGNPSSSLTGGIDCDCDSLPGAHVTYGISRSHNDPVGAGEMSRSLDNDQPFIRFEFKLHFRRSPAPSDPAQGTPEVGEKPG